MRIMNEQERFTCVDWETANLINLLTDSKLNFTREGDAGVNMCQAILEIREEGKVEGRVEGKAEGKTESLKQISALSLAMAKDGRDMDFLDAMHHPEKLPALLKDYGIV